MKLSEIQFSLLRKYIPKVVLFRNISESVHNIYNHSLNPVHYYSIGVRGESSIVKTTVPSSF